MVFDVIRFRELRRKFLKKIMSTVFSLSGFGDIAIRNRDKGSSSLSRAFSSSIGTLQFKESNKDSFLGRTVDANNNQKYLSSNSNVRSPKSDPVYAQVSGVLGKAMRWWEKSLQPNMVEINSAQELVDNLLNAGDRLVIVDFYSPGCGGCKALHPKICQLAEQNPDAIFLTVNYEEHKPMCYALHVHVLPFFRFYRGAEGKVCSFSCTNATIKKFRDALAKHGPERCTLGPAKGLEESELMALASIGLISRELVPNPNKSDQVEDLVFRETVKSNIEVNEGNAMVMA